MAKGNISNILQNTEELQPMVKAAMHISKLSGLLSDILKPPLITHTAISHIDKGNLVLHTGNSATASKLHQLKNYLLTNIQKNHSEVVNIEIKVIPNQQSPGPTVTEPNAKFEGKAAFDEISSKIPSGPLKLVIDRMRKNLKR